MKEVVRVNLENEMDLIIAHKRTMKLAELCGLSLSSQTSFATAVSEIARCAIGHGTKSYLALGILPTKPGKKEIYASIVDGVEFWANNKEAITYATRLADNIEIIQTESDNEVRLGERINFGGTFTDIKIDTFIEYFKNEAPVSFYDEVRKKNIQLIDLSEKLRQSESQYRTLTDTLPLMMFSLNTAGEVIYSNRWLNNFFELHGQNANFSWLEFLYPADRKSIVQLWEKAQQDKTVFRVQARIKQKNKDGFLWHLISIVPFKKETGSIASWTGFFVDVHAQKLVEETLKDNVELKQAQHHLKQYQTELEKKIEELNISNHDLEQFAYIASHDLQEPLRKIKAFSELLEANLTADKVGEKAKNYLDKIIHSSARMSELINDVLNYSRLTKGDYQFKQVDLNDILRLVKTDFELLITQKSAVVQSDNLPILHAVPQQITQLFGNLISNSLKFTQHNPVISITSSLASPEEIERLRLNGGRAYQKLVFEDNGIGFEQQYAEKIFVIFQRLNDRYSYSGTGIGLALCRRIVENHHGAITASSELGKGASFSVYLPEEVI